MKLKNQMSRIIREANQNDITEIMQVMEAAKKIMRSSGNLHQWADGYWVCHRGCWQRCGVFRFPAFS